MTSLNCGHPSDNGPHEIAGRSDAQVIFLLHAQQNYILALQTWQPLWVIRDCQSYWSLGGLHLCKFGAWLILWPWEWVHFNVLNPLFTSCFRETSLAQHRGVNEQSEVLWQGIGLTSPLGIFYGDGSLTHCPTPWGCSSSGFSPKAVPT